MRLKSILDIKSYKKENGKTYYKFRIYIGIENGKRKYIKRAGFKTKSEARSAILNIQEELDNPKASDEILFKEVYKKWLKQYEKQVIDSTYYKTTRTFKNHILPDLGHLTLKEITPKLLQNKLNDWCDKLKFGRKLLGPVKQVFDFAIQREYIQINPTLSVSAPKIKREIKVKKDFYNPDELKEFMKLVEKTDNIKKIALFRLLAFTGIRKGELLALTWADYYDNTLSINKALSRSDAGLELSTTKTKSSERLISLDKKTCNILDELHKTYPKSKKLFEAENGGFLSPTKPRKWLLSIIKDSKLEPIKIHGFRHTHASLIFDAGMTLKQAQQRLGHSDLNTTMNVYTHITEKAVDDIGERFSNYIDF